MTWAECNGQDQVKHISGTLYRMVEAQEQVATMGYVDTLEEQSILEDLLEQSKPDYLEATERLHYLLRTPFRYPPLQWGSRFGRVHEPSLFYGGQSVETTLTESAFYRLVFLFAMEAEPPKRSLRSEHSVFSVGYATGKGVKLHEPPFDAYGEQLTHNTHYSVCQNLGSDMRAAGVDAFEYLSARSPEEGLCVALFSPDAFSQDEPSSNNRWLCEASPDGVVFKEEGARSPFFYDAELFMTDGIFPMPGYGD